MKVVCLFIGALLAISIADCQTEKKEFLVKVQEICPAADIVNIEMKTDYTEIDFWCNGVLTEVGINHNLEVIFTETEVKVPDNVLQKITNKLDKKYYGWSIDEYALVKLHDTAFYKVEILKGGLEENIYFTTDGKYYKTKNTLVKEYWDLESLANSEHYQKAPYNFLNPHKTYDVPEILKEISGIAWAGNNILYCVQDETGIIFKYDISKEELSGMIRFTDFGDFEDISLNGDTAYILRSDGTLFYFSHKNFGGKYETTVIPLNCLNIESLFLDKTDKTFLIACKDNSINTYGSYRSVYAFPINSMYSPEIALTIDLNEINKMLHVKYPELSVEKIQFNPSAIAVHPLTKEVYILSAINRMLAIYHDKKLTDLFPLPAELYYKPEGLDFTEDGNLFISSEGMKKGYLDGQIFYLEKK